LRYLNSDAAFLFQSQLQFWRLILRTKFTAVYRSGAAGRRSGGHLVAGRAGDPPRQRSFNPNAPNSLSRAKRRPAPYRPAWRTHSPHCSHRRNASRPAPQGP